jgi:hypothetical protein
METKATKMEDIRTTTTRKTTSREPQRRTLSTDMRRKRVKMVNKARKERNLNLRRSMSPSKRRLTKPQKLRKLKQRTRPQNQSKTLLLNEKEIRSIC